MVVSSQWTNINIRRKFGLKDEHMVKTDEHMVKTDKHMVKTDKHVYNRRT